MYALVVHGGAGRAPRDAELPLAGVRLAAEAGRACLAAGGAAIDAVVAAVVVLEDDESFNAGTGSVLNARGEAEFDAGVMVGDGLRSGNVAALRGVRNPVLVARRVMEETPHVLLAGEGALQFARAAGFGHHDGVTARRMREWRESFEALRRGEKDARATALHARYPELFGDTVGAVAVDAGGCTAAATSTGGIAMKLPGRVGDSPVPGAGNYATPAAAVSVTGQGELMLRFLTAKAVSDRIGAGAGANDAVHAVIGAMQATVGGDVGIIAVSATGDIGIAHGTEAMVHAWVCEGMTGIECRAAVGAQSLGESR